MNKNTAKIKSGIKTLVDKQHEIISGTVISGSIDETKFTISVQPTDGSAPVENVMLSTITESNKGLILIPEEGSHVIIGNVDGPGIWALIRAGEITKAVITIGSVMYEMDDARIAIKNGDSLFDVGSALFKMNTSNESLFQLLNDMIDTVQNMTAGGYPMLETPPSTPFALLKTRLSNLLSA